MPRVEETSYVLMVHGKIFSAAHFIEGHAVCGNLHGHNYTVNVGFRVSHWTDFHRLEEVVGRTIAKYDHKDLGNMTVEELADAITVDIWARLKHGLKHATIEYVEVWETPKYGVRVDG